MKSIASLLKNKEFRRGFKFAIGVALVFDILFLHNIVKLHPTIEGPNAIYADVVLILLGIFLIIWSAYGKNRG